MTMQVSVVPVSFPSRRSLLTRMRADGPTLSLFAPTERAVPLGSRVRLEISLLDSQVTYSVVGNVQFRRAVVRGAGQEVGLSVTFEGAEKRAAAEMMAFCAGRPAELGSALTPRRPLALNCVVHAGEKRLRGEVRDLSNGGAFVVVPRASGLRIGSELVLQLAPLFSRWGGRRVRARVVWVGSKLGRHGFGARFVTEPSQLQSVVRKYLQPEAS